MIYIIWSKNEDRPALAHSAMIPCFLHRVYAEVYLKEFPNDDLEIKEVEIRQ